MQSFPLKLKIKLQIKNSKELEPRVTEEERIKKKVDETLNKFKDLVPKD